MDNDFTCTIFRGAVRIGDSTELRADDDVELVIRSASPLEITARALPQPRWTYIPAVAPENMQSINAAWSEFGASGPADANVVTVRFNAGEAHGTLWSGGDTDTAPGEVDGQGE